MTQLDILIPTCNRPAALAVTLTSLCAQSFSDFRLIISDQTQNQDVFSIGEVEAVLRVLQAHGHNFYLYKHLPQQGMAEHRQFLLDRAEAPYVLYLDDDLILEPWVIQTLMQAMQMERCGFVGAAPIGLSFCEDIRPHQQQVTFWEGAVTPEVITVGTPEWERYQLHNAANLYHVQQYLNLTPVQWRKYKVAWIGGCVLFDTLKLRSIGGFSFWPELPLAHCGEDVLVQLRLMQRYGGCGVMPSGVYHQELPTTIPDRRFDAPHLLPLDV